ncbi:unnamed protein product [Arctia plantaginis]|uniref:Uncharacterized protein n=1 Tax=Arctia plantaginis TaxID=874455 RepID=A0A8S0ZDG5_ARCPL|nr:unnamed protein product [Arctia plantaginis]
MSDVTENQSTSEPLLSPSQLSDPTTSTSAQSSILPNPNPQQQQAATGTTNLPFRHLESPTPASDFVAQTATCVQRNFRAALLEVSPSPDASKRRATARRRKAERSEIITSSPYEKMLEEIKIDY